MVTKPIETGDKQEAYFDIIIPNEIGPLGIHVVPCDTETDGRLLVQGIEPGGRVDRDGRLAVSDSIVAINGYQLRETNFTKAQEIFKEALFAKELRLRVLKGNGTTVQSFNNDKENMIEAGASPASKQILSSSASSTLTRKTEMAAGTKITSAVHANNTRKIGKLMKINLQKGASGLGFSITTRDNALGDNTPIYIKNILAKGAARDDGNLKPGDRLIEVNDVVVDGMSQSDVVTLLRNVPFDSTVSLVVSRHEAAGAVSSSANSDQNQKSETNLGPRSADNNSSIRSTGSGPSSKSAGKVTATTQTSGGKGTGKKLHSQIDSSDNRNNKADDDDDFNCKDEEVSSKKAKKNRENRT